MRYIDLNEGQCLISKNYSIIMFIMLEKTSNSCLWLRIEDDKFSIVDQTLFDDLNNEIHSIWQIV